MHNNKLIFETWKQKLVAIVVAVTFDGGVTNNGYEGTSPHSLPQMKSYGLRLLTDSAMNSKYLLLCKRGSVSLNSYTSCVQCSALCWK
jgi:hypothetical protein